MLTYKQRVATIIFSAALVLSGVSSFAAYLSSMHASNQALKSLAGEQATRAWEKLSSSAVSESDRVGAFKRSMEALGYEQVRVEPKSSDLNSGDGLWVSEGLRGAGPMVHASAKFEMGAPRMAQIEAEALRWAWLTALAVFGFGALVYVFVVLHMRRNLDFNREAVESQIAMIEALGAAIAKRDSDTGAHNFRVAWIAARIGQRMGVKDRILQALIAGSFLHDVGKIGIPDAILLKPGKLVGEELDIMRTHVALGEQILNRIPWLRSANDVVSGHHEKWDGSGYPRGLAGDAIPLLARIFAVADVYDALTSRRPYKAPMDYAETMAILRRDEGTHFDPKVMAAFEPISKEIYERLDGAHEDEARDLLGEMLRANFGLNTYLK